MILGFTGKARSGKTTASDYVVENFGFIKINFKDALIKEMRERLPDVLVHLSEMYDMTIDELFIEKPPAMRALMKNYGTEVRRGDKDSYWTDQWMESVKVQIELGNDVVTDDVRFLNEAECIKETGGAVVRIIRSDITGDTTHKSETEMDQIVVSAEIMAEKDGQDVVFNMIDELMKTYGGEE